MWSNLLEDDSGQSMVEYLLLTILIALAALASVKGIGTWLTELFAWLGYASHYLTD